MGNNSKLNRVVKDISNTFLYHLEERIISEIDNFKDILLKGFDGLSARVTDPNSKTDPAIFRDQFEEEINNFDFIREHPTTGIQIELPDMGNFNFRGMEIIERILEGTPGTYVEVTHEDLEKLTGKTTVNDDPIDPTVPKKERVYVIQYTPSLKNKEQTILGKALVKFPFSNVPPLEDEVFGVLDEYYEENIDDWIDDATKKSSKLLKTKY